MYATVATLRERLRNTTFFSAVDRKAFSGPDPNIASQRLLGDVVSMLHRAENRVFEMRFGASIREKNETHDHYRPKRNQHYAGWFAH